MRGCFFYIALLLIVFSNSVFAEYAYFLGCQAGGNFQNCTYLAKRHCSLNGGYNLGIMGGCTWANGLSLDLETSFRNNPYNLNGRTESGDPTVFHGHVDIGSFMANGRYDLLLVPYEITPYIGAGAGWDLVHQSIKISKRRYGGSHSGFAWQLMTGLSYPFWKYHTVELEYKYHVAPIKYNQHIRNHSITIGVNRFFCY